ncbi:phosphopantetheine-binding protein [Streptomyces sp. NPDC090052]|uniref:phosphopantetheine-binding protein n=1 Tax=unclassified Streptomyces TaxID=2593676 RepID=UPI0022515A42|nr:MULTISPECIES: phosphopantetheine-binding protein [unclassified Streptomyces]MCX4723206.1 phosphopantetheine-binding protein [Streptomyces sp. NBC_01306]WSV07173.1 phosphopantetheine-binding protein [Streptomyces sp. NBC_01020]WSX45287.1 phosphopantetheine-binding protein [Streptomyces sp. NBC_00963]WSX66689.1 phosphopantetheine-binding protein [Streptomyces sp. NBC_00932]
MWDEQFEELLRKYLPFLGPHETLTADSGLRDLGLDSLGTVEMLASLETMYDVRFVDDMLTTETFATPGVLWAAVSRSLAR